MGIVRKRRLTGIEHARLKEHVTRMDGMLDAIVHEGGMYLLATTF